MTDFSPADHLILQHSHSAFDRIAQRGYRLQYGRQRQDEKNLHVQALNQEGRVSGSADFTEMGRFAYCQNVRVEEDCQRQGIANAMYVLAEIVFGTWLSDFWGNHGDNIQSNEGRGLWQQPNRPFGNPGFVAGRPKA